MTNYDVTNRKPDLLVTRSTVGKQAKRMPEATVKTTANVMLCRRKKSVWYNVKKEDTTTMNYEIKNFLRYIERFFLSVLFSS